MSSDAPAIVWFRQDLRLTDNPALAAACANGRPVIALYILDEESEGVRPPGGASRWWLHKSLESLALSLSETGQRLVLRRGGALGVLKDLVRETGASSVLWNRCYEPGAIARDTAVKSVLQSAGVDVESFNASLLLEPWQIETGQGGPYKVFTPFWNRLRELHRPPTLVEPAARIPAVPSVAGDDLDQWSLLPDKPDWAGGLRDAWEVGEAAAQQRLSAFLDAPVADYPTDRDRPDRPGTSCLSPHLHWGEIGPHQVWRAAASLIYAGDPRSGGAESLLRELAWRDFNHHLLFHFPTIVTANWRPKFDAFPWRDDPQGLAAWQCGQTGYPIVDAGMRELWATGWMHNRVRMIVGSFLVKDLLTDWRAGEAWFWDTLVDADLANNVGNWQWVAGSGADASPFFRIFNPVSQGEKFDPQGGYVRRWVPELADVPDKWIHRPWDAPADVRAAANFTLGGSYPRPIVDHARARVRALEIYKSLSDPDD
ncbi:MAG: deoxyribodipyrimidine photolyase [Alphaproteobacteria bacterium]|nr:deoxyribodipyrimidine photolyase [Alphaproteobacteria bacterium]